MILAAQTTPAHARASVPVIEYLDQTILTSSGKPPTLDRVRQAIMKAAVANQWSLAKVGDQQFTGTLVVRGKHTIVFDITFATDKYSLKYKDSNNMNYKLVDGMPLIHPNCNVWTRALINTINKELLEA